MSRIRSRTLIRTAGWTALGTAAAVWCGDRAPYPYGWRWMLDLPLPCLTSACLDRVLVPRPGERMLEIGPGTGLQALHVAPHLGPTGRLDVLDVQQPMLDHVMGRANALGIGNIVPTRGDARELPFADGVFDAVYCVTALGEVPRPGQALSEAERVLAPGGRIVVGEFLDRHWIPLARLRDHADACGLHLDTRSGSAVAYLARFRRCQARMPSQLVAGAGAVGEAAAAC